jgi:hypothetical protein
MLDNKNILNYVSGVLYYVYWKNQKFKYKEETMFKETLKTKEFREFVGTEFVPSLVNTFREKLKKKFENGLGTNWIVGDYFDWDPSIENPSMLLIVKKDWLDNDNEEDVFNNSYFYYEIGSYDSFDPNISFRGLGINLHRLVDNKGNLFNGVKSGDELDELIEQKDYSTWKEIQDYFDPQLLELFSKIEEIGKQIFQIDESNIDEKDPYSIRCLFEPIYPEELKLVDDLESIKKILPEKVDAYVESLYNDLMPFIRETEKIVDEIVALPNR